MPKILQFVRTVSLVLGFCRKIPLNHLKTFKTAAMETKVCHVIKNSRLLLQEEHRLAQRMQAALVVSLMAA